MSYFMPAFWPIFKTTEKRIFMYPGFSSTFQYDPKHDSMCYINHDDKGTWLNTWFYKYRPGFGIAEWRDDLPQTDSKVAIAFGKVKTLVFAPPISWFENVEVGHIYINQPKYDALKCVPPVLTGQIGHQAVGIDAHHEIFKLANGVDYHDVLQFTCRQTWGSTTTFLRFWMAFNLGPIAIQMGENLPRIEVHDIMRR